VILLLALLAPDIPGALWAVPLYGGQWGLIAGAVVLGGQWLIRRTAGGLTSNGLLLIAVLMCSVLVIWLLSVQYLSWLWVWLPIKRSLPFVSVYVTPGTVAASGLSGGVMMAALVVAWRRESWLRSIRNVAAGGLLASAFLYLVWPSWSPLWRPTRAAAQATACQSNLRSLGKALSAYAVDADGHLPTCGSANDLLGVDYEQLEAMLAPLMASDEIALIQPSITPRAHLGGGPLDAYLRNASIFFCPSDPSNLDSRGRPIIDRFPEPGISYTWNEAAAGNTLEAMPPDTWLLRDREPWHNGGRNVVDAEGRAMWRPEAVQP
jgi:hypothetical protein